ncbi:hypothetical protein GS399_05255 [Pedobacter sp. HMF7647]|uniref:PKD domain-containing protein n=1 Tax=Hufsiella arboris TaxID=2695275 RepID=A0A7K1Y718_9SPHI|nr:PKD domain-containing protein [Hufsiella arboris]MXV50372.1 hypothetical protein [Hufsiella arboris]
MSKIYAKCLLFFLLFILAEAKAQNKIVSVNPLTGTANVVIPIYKLTSGNVSIPVNVVYSATGVKVKDVEGKAGIGWQLNVGGAIRRDLRGLPDDCQKDNLGNNLAGWLYNPTGSAIENFSVTNDGNTATCPDETADINYLNGNFANNKDTEPDVFSIDAPGLSCQFVFDKNHVVRTIPQRDLNITYTTDVAGLINSFTIINDKGIKYVFDVTELEGIIPLLGTERLGHWIDESTIAYFKRKYYQYKGGVRFNSAWHLSSVTDADGNRIILNYDNDDERDNITPLELYIPGNQDKKVIYFLRDHALPKRVTSMSISNPNPNANAAGIYEGSAGVSFQYNLNEISYRSFISRIYVPGAAYLFNYSNVGSRYFLRDISTDQCNSPVNYHFSYLGESFASNRYTTLLPDSSSKSIDYWGYANNTANSDLRPSLVANPSNPALPKYALVTDSYSRPNYTVQLGASNRMCNPASVAWGTLNQISYLDNGSTTLEYEPNTYFDVAAGAAVTGGGIRVSKVTDYDGMQTANNIVKTYAYINPATGLTSGKPLSLPVFAFSRPYSSVDEAASVVRSEEDLSDEDHTIVYSHVRESQLGAGNTLYEYNTTGTYWDNTAEWSPAFTFAGRLNCSSIGVLSNRPYAYPFAPNLNYDVERGQLKQITGYNEAGQEVSESVYSYQLLGTPIVISGLRFEDNDYAKSYSKYAIKTSIVKAVSQITSKVFDSETVSQPQLTSTIYRYTSPNHLLLTQQETTSNGRTEIQNFTYAKDYFTSSGATSSSALYTLNQRNMNLPVEQYLQVKAAGSGVFKTVLARLTKYGFFTDQSQTHILPAQQLSLTSADGLDNFQAASNVSNVFAYDAQYDVKENYSSYNYWGDLQTQDDNNKRVTTFITKNQTHNLLAAISNARISEVGCFDADNWIFPASFIKDNPPYNYTQGRNGFALSLETGATLSKSLNRAVNSKNYIFSCWINAVAAGAITLSLTDNVSGQSSAVNLAYVSAAGQWKYYELKVPVTLISNGFTAKFQSNTAIGVDDVFFYPENAEVTSYAYSANNFKISETNTNGVANYFSNDNFGRPTLVYDQDKQIKLRKSYQSSFAGQLFTNPAFGISPNIYAGSSTNFTPFNNLNLCQYTGITETWDFGDGTVVTSTSLNAGQSHIFQAVGSYTVTYTVSVAGYGSKSTSVTVHVENPPPPPPPPAVRLLYTNNTSTGTFSYVRFYQNGTLLYTFYKADLDAGIVTVPFGVYDVKVHCDDTYGSLYAHGDAVASCTPYTKGLHSFTMNLSNSTFLNFEVNAGTCN